MSAHSNPVIVKEVGVDYITTTSHSGTTTRHLCAFAEWLVSQEIQKGCRSRPWRNTGYCGTVAGSVAFGVSQQGGIVRASGEVSQQHWQQLHSLADNVTRLDLQVTLPAVAGTTATLRKHHRELLNAPRTRGKPLQFKVYYGPDGPEGIHVGRRVSDRFGRVYDKGLESRSSAYDGHLRYELELHRTLALRTTQMLDSQELDQLAMVHQVHSFFLIREFKLASAWLLPPAGAVITASQLRDCELPPRVKKSAPEVVRALRWMHNSVRPAIARLFEAGYHEEVLRALELDQVVHRNLEERPEESRRLLN